jgi:hypothetical protein
MSLYEKEAARPAEITYVFSLFAESISLQKQQLSSRSAACFFTDGAAEMNFTARFPKLEANRNRSSTGNRRC